MGRRSKYRPLPPALRLQNSKSAIISAIDRGLRLGETVDTFEDPPRVRVGIRRWTCTAEVLESVRQHLRTTEVGHE